MQRAVERYVKKGGNIPTSVLLDDMIQKRIQRSINQLMEKIEQKRNGTSTRLEKELLLTFAEYRDKIVCMFQNDFTKMEAEIRGIEEIEAKKNHKCKMGLGKNLLKKNIEEGIQELMEEKKSEPLLDVYAVERTLYICHMIEEGILEWKVVEKILGYNSTT